MVDDTIWNMKSSLSLYIYIPLLDRHVGLEQRNYTKVVSITFGFNQLWGSCPNLTESFCSGLNCPSTQNDGGIRRGHGQYWSHHHLVNRPLHLHVFSGRTRIMQWPRLQMPWMPPVQGLRIFPKNHVMILGSRVGVWKDWKGRRSVNTDDWRPIALIC